MRKYIFDIDGTLTPSRGLINTNFKRYMLAFMGNNYVYFVTGSDKPKTVEQIGTEIYNRAVKVYQCSGNDVWERGKNIRKGTIKLPDTIWGYLNKEISESEFPVRTGIHIEERPGLVNLSIVGRNAGQRARTQYIHWDNHTNERKNISERLSKLFPDFDFKLGGETGIDITVKGNNKSQVLTDFENCDIINFYGDKCDLGGNDHEIALAVHDRGGKNATYQVKDWKETWEILKQK